MTSSVCLLPSSHNSTLQTFIAVFKTGAIFSFEGSVEIKILAGSVDINGFVVSPPRDYLTVHSPSSEPRAVISTPRHVAPVACSRFIDHNSIDEISDDQMMLDLSYEDIRQLNNVLSSDIWKDASISAIGLLRETSSVIVDSLTSYGSTLSLFELTKQSSNPIRNMSIMINTDSSLIIPESYRGIASDVSASNRPVVLVIGGNNCGKSWFCRLLINLLLNKHEMVGFMECDVGQSEFTIPGVVSLHLITEPVFGPSFVHLKRPRKSFVYGDNSPKDQLDFYTHLIELCMKHYHDDIKEGVPLIVNTCGWTNGLGIPLLCDIVQIVSPTHLVQFIGDKSSQSELPPLTYEYIMSNSNWNMSPDNDDVQVSLVRDIDLFTTDDIELMKQQCKRAKMTHDELSDLEVPLTLGGRKRLMEMESSGDGKRGKYESPEGGAILESKWLNDMKCRHFVLSNFNSHSLESKITRKASIISYFSPLLSETSGNKTNFILSAAPYKIKWNSIAVHSIHKKVPYSQILYAINGSFVSLAHVNEDEIIDYCPGLVKGLRSHHPEAEFIGCGLVRGIDPISRLIYVTTPLSGRQLDDVNCLILGNSERPLDVISQDNIKSTHPYILERFRHQDYGKFIWNS